MIKSGKNIIKIINKETSLGSSRLELKISGDDINYVVINTIRRVILNNIPIYAFADFNFEKNTSIFHNNYLKQRFRQLPVWNIENKNNFIDYKELKKKELEDINESKEEYNDDNNQELQEEKKDINMSSLKQLTMFISYKNKSNTIYTVSTNDAKFYFDQKQIDSPYNNPIPLVKLQPNQEIIVSCITKLGTELEDAMYNAGLCYYNENKENDFNFIIESRGQLTEKNILLVALDNIDRKINTFIKLNNQEKYDDKEDGMIVSNDNDHTLGNLITRGMQQHKDINFASYRLPHPFVATVHFHYNLKKNGNIKKIINDVCEYYLDVFNDLKKQIKNI